MKIYEIIIQESKFSSDQNHYIMANDFDDAVAQAHKRLVTSKKDDRDAYIESVSEQFELEVVK